MLSQSSTTVTPPPPSSMSSMDHSVTHSLCRMWHVKHIIKDPGINAVNELFQIHHHHHQTVSPLWLAWPGTLRLNNCCEYVRETTTSWWWCDAGWLVGADLLTGRRMPLKHPIQISRNNYFRRRWRIQSRYIGTPVTVSKITATNNESICVA